jgi:hypothetical protein
MSNNEKVGKFPVCWSVYPDALFRSNKLFWKGNFYSQDQQKYFTILTFRAVTRETLKKNRIEDNSSRLLSDAMIIVPGPVADRRLPL